MADVTTLVNLAGLGHVLRSTNTNIFHWFTFKHCAIQSDLVVWMRENST